MVTHLNIPKSKKHPKLCTFVPFWNSGNEQNWGEYGGYGGERVIIRTFRWFVELSSALFRCVLLRCSIKKVTIFTWFSVDMVTFSI